MTDKRSYQRSAISRRIARNGFLLGVVIQIEMLGLDDLEVKRSVLDLALSEVLRRSRAGRDAGKR